MLRKYNIGNSEPRNHIILKDMDLYIFLPLDFQQILKITLVSKKIDEIAHNVNHFAQSLAYIKSAQ